MNRFTAAAALALAGVAIPAAAQSPTAAPTNGVVALRGGFAPDPHEVRVQAGGPVYTGTALTGCAAGYIPDAPQVRVDYTAGDRPLTISADSEGDATLAVHAPDGRWLCNDDGPDGLDPQVSIPTPASGAYAIFVGRYGEGTERPAATLRLSNAAPAARQAEPEPEPDAPPTPRTPPPDPDLPPAQGTLELRGGFSPDPRTLPVQAGGPTDTAGIEGCNGGFVSQAPAVRLTWGGGAGPLVMSVSSQADTTLAVRSPTGAWTCNDDSDASLDPQVTLPTPVAGRYDIFVGRFGVQGDTAPATLRLSRTPPPVAAPEPEPSAAPAAIRRRPTPALRPTYGALTLRTGFKPDPVTVAVHAGGPLDATMLGEGCAGVIADAPSVRLAFTAGAHPLSISVRGQADTTLAIRGPDGRFTCNDDSDGLNPRVTYQRPRSGRYDVWVGTFGAVNPAAPPAVTLRVSEMVELPSEPAPSAE